MQSKPVLTGLVLAGGQSLRLRGYVDAEGLAADQDATPDKGLIPFRGSPLVAHACNYLRGQGVTGPILISANRHAEAYGRYGRVLVDTPRHGAFQGPLLGMLAGLEALRTDWLLVIPVDVPGLPGDMFARLRSAADADHPAYARSQDGAHPLCVLLPKSLGLDLEAWLAAGNRKVQAWLASVGARAVDFGEARFLNLNTPEDWKNATADAPVGFQSP